MYNEFLNLTSNPFSETPDTRFTYLGESLTASLEALERGLDQGLGFCLLTGEVGVGKTHLTRALLKRVESKTNSALVLFPNLEGRDLMVAIAQEFGLVVERGASLQAVVSQITDFLIHTATQKRRSLLVIDEAHNMSVEALELIRQLSNIEQESVKLLQIILVGQPELKKKLSQESTRQIQQRISLRLELKELNAAEATRYIKHRIDVAGGTNYIQFHDLACDTIARLSGGKPRLINLQCRLVLDYASRHRIRLIGKPQVLTALREAGLLKVERTLPWRKDVRLVHA